MDLYDFVIESNKIEGIDRTYNREIIAHEKFLNLKEITVRDVEYFVKNIAKASIRSKLGMNVRVGNYYPPKGGIQIYDMLFTILKNSKKLNAYELHIEYEKLHAFMDGNGRSGRAIWAWQKKHENQDPFSLPFLHRFYYEILEHSR